MSVLADYKFYVDWNNDKDFGEAYEDISADVAQASWRTGFNGPPPDKANAGTLNLTLRNGTGKYTSTNPNSPIVATYGGIRPGLRTRVSMSVNGIDWVVMWQGFLDTIIPSTGSEVLEGGTAELTALGPFSRIATGDVNIALQEQISTCDAADQLLTAIGWSGAERQMDIGQTTLYKWWVRNEQSPLDALRELESAELGRLWESKDGKIVLDDRHHIFDAPHATHRVLYGVGGNLKMWEPELQDSKAIVYNAYRGNQRTFNLSDDVALVTLIDQPNGQGGKPLEIGPFKTITVWMELNAQNTPDNYISVYEWGSAGTGLDCFIYDNPVSQAGNEITDDFTIDRDDFGPKMRVIITNTSGTTGYVTTLIAYGVAVVETDPIAIKVDDPASQEIYGVCEYPEPDPWCTDFADGYDMAQYLVDASSSEGGIMANPRTQVRFKLLANVDATHLLEAQTIDINERIHISDAAGTFGLYVNSDFIIDSLEHTVDNVGRLHSVIVSCTIAPDHSFGPTDTEWSGNVTPPEPGTLVPDGLHLITVDPTRTVVVGLSAEKNNETIDQAELRFYYTTTAFGTSVDLRLQSEGGQFVPNGTTRLDLTLAAGASGVNYQFNTGIDITGRGR